MIHLILIVPLQCIVYRIVTRAYTDFNTSSITDHHFTSLSQTNLFHNVIRIVISVENQYELADEIYLS